MENYTDVESQVEYGLEKIDPNRKIEVSLKDFLYLHNVVGEFIRFFHQPLHYETLEYIEKFLGNKEQGGFHLLSEVYYEKFYWSNIYPEDVQQMVNNGDFQNPKYPYYYKP